MKIAVSGSTGLVGQALVEHLDRGNHLLVLIRRDDFSRGSAHLAEKIEGCHAVVNLAGAPVLKRWTKSYKRLILSSRTETTTMLSEAIALTEKKPSVFLSASAVGIYQQGMVSSESKPVIGHDFLAEVCHQWEASTAVAEPVTRVIHLRFGVVLSAHGGALATMLPIFRLGLGGMTGTGEQSFPWIHIHDLTAVVSFLLSHQEVSGPVNLVAPGLISNAIFTASLAKALRRPSIFTVPAFALRLIYGEGSSTLLNAAEVIPEKLIKLGFEYKYPEIQPALDHLVATKK